MIIEYYTQDKTYFFNWDNIIKALLDPNTDSLGLRYGETEQSSITSHIISAHLIFLDRLIDAVPIFTSQQEIHNHFMQQVTALCRPATTASAASMPAPAATSNSPVSVSNPRKIHSTKRGGHRSYERAPTLPLEEFAEFIMALSNEQELSPEQRSRLNLTSIPSFASVKGLPGVTKDLRDQLAKLRKQAKNTCSARIVRRKNAAKISSMEEQLTTLQADNEQLEADVERLTAEQHRLILEISAMEQKLAREDAGMVAQNQINEQRETADLSASAQQQHHEGLRFFEGVGSSFNRVISGNSARSSGPTANNGY